MNLNHTFILLLRRKQSSVAFGLCKRRVIWLPLYIYVCDRKKPSFPKAVFIIAINFNSYTNPFQSWVVSFTTFT